MRLVSMATADVTVVDKVAELIERITRQGVGIDFVLFFKALDTFGNCQRPVF